jgi:hypothetical protein
MTDTPARTIFDIVTDFLVSEPTSDTILAFHLPDDLQDYARWLLERNREGRLTNQEVRDLDDFIRIDDLMTLLKAKARQKLQQA